MNGFESELRDRLLSLSAPVRVTARPGSELSTAQWQEAARRLGTVAGVTDVARYAEVQALAVRQPEMVPVLLRGIDPDRRRQQWPISGPLLVQGHSSDLTAGSNAVIVGAVIAEQPGVGPGTRSRCWCRRSMPTAPRAAAARVHGRRRVPGRAAGPRQHADVGAIDDVRAFAREATGRERTAAALHQRARPRRTCQRCARRSWRRTWSASDWTQDNASYFRAIRIEKTMMALILLLIVAVAAFNIVAMLVMVVNDKRTDIAILRTFGASSAAHHGDIHHPGPGRSAGSACCRGGAGRALASTSTPSCRCSSALFHFQFLDAEVYYITTHSLRGALAQRALDRGAALVLTAAVDHLPGAARRAHAAGRRAALRVSHGCATNG